MIVGMFHAMDILNLSIDPDQLAAILTLLSGRDAFRFGGKTKTDQDCFDDGCGRIFLDVLWHFGGCCLVHGESESGICQSGRVRIDIEWTVCHLHVVLNEDRVAATDDCEGGWWVHLCQLLRRHFVG